MSATEGESEREAQGETSDDGNTPVTEVRLLLPHRTTREHRGEDDGHSSRSDEASSGFAACLGFLTSKTAFHFMTPCEFKELCTILMKLGSTHPPLLQGPRCRCLRSDAVVCTWIHK